MILGRRLVAPFFGLVPGIILHRTGKRRQDVVVPLYRLHFAPAFFLVLLPIPLLREIELRVDHV